MIFPAFRRQWNDAAGDPLALGSLTFLLAGTATPGVTYSDEGLSIANPNPIVLNSAGRAEVSGTEIDIWANPVLYDVVVRSSTGSILYTAQDIAGQPPGGPLPASFTAGDLLVASSATTLTSLPAAAAGQVLASQGVGVAPAYTANPSVTSLTTSGDVTVGDEIVFTGSGMIRTDTVDGADTGGLTLTPGGAATPARGPALRMEGNDVGGAGAGGGVSIRLGIGATNTFDINASVGGADVFQVTDAGLVLLHGGSLVFPATPIPSVDPNALDDYVEGTFTPVLTFLTPGNLAVAYSAQVGTYTKIGNQIFISIYLATSGFTHTTASGKLLITGFPFAPVGVEQVGAISYQGITKATYTSFASAFDPPTALIQVMASGSGVARATVMAADMPTGGSVILSIRLSCGTT